MAEPYEPKPRQRSRLWVPDTWHWSLPVWLLLGLYVGIYGVTLAASLESLGAHHLEQEFGLSLSEVWTGPWRLFTFSLFHSPARPLDFLVILFSLVVVLPGLEKSMGWWRLLFLYLVSATGAGLTHLAFSVALPHLVDPTVRTLGASGAIYGLLAAYFWFLRGEDVFGLIRVKLLAPILVVLLLILAQFASEGALEYRTQSAGLLFGAGVLVLAPRLQSLRARRASARRIREIVRDAEIEARVDRLLEKISRDGMDALSRSERRYLRKVSPRYRRAPPKKTPPEG